MPTLSRTIRSFIETNEMERPFRWGWHYGNRSSGPGMLIRGFDIEEGFVATTLGAVSDLLVAA